MLPAPRWSVSQRPDTLQPIPDTSTTPGRCTAQHSRTIIIMYIRVQQCACYRPMPDSPAYRRPCQPGAPADVSASPPVRGQPGGVSILPTPGGDGSGTGSAVRAHRVSLAPSTRRSSPAGGAQRAARNHWRLSPHLFSGFRPIANRGQQ